MVFRAGRNVWVWLNHSARQWSILTLIQRDHKTKAVADVYWSPKEKTFKDRDGKQEIMNVAFSFPYYFLL